MTSWSHCETKKMLKNQLKHMVNDKAKSASRRLIRKLKNMLKKTHKSNFDFIHHLTSLLPFFSWRRQNACERTVFFLKRERTKWHLNIKRMS